MRRTERWRMQARVAARGLVARARQVLTTEPGTAPDAGEEASARALASEARRLRGGVGKSAQLAGYLDAFDLEADVRAALATLWDHMEPAGAEIIEEVVRAELGAPPAALFTRWEAEPFAAASLGQVHAATGADGIEYAVKVQYPEAAAVLDDDLRGDRLVRRLAGTALGGRLSGPAIEALRGAIHRELDYRAEAAASARFQRAFAGDPDIVIPTVIPERSAGRVLTMHRVRGQSLPEVAAGPEPLRAAAAAAILRFAWTAPLRHGLVHGDPNPGNYLVLPGPPAKVAFLDFGCAAELDETTRDGERTLWRALLHRDVFAASERFRQALHAQGMIPNPRSFGEDAYREWEDLVTAPVRARSAFPWTADHAIRLLAATRRVVGAELLQIPAPLVLLWRQRLGVAAVLAMLGAPADARAALEQALASP
jgi:predicted unusual protein kinase regulating ubiquinone biosynthesis (AarF/ABC1/UbiB family)